MIKKVLLIFSLLFTFSYGNKENFNKDIQNKLSEKLEYYDISYIQEDLKSKLRFKKTSSFYDKDKNYISQKFANILSSVFPDLILLIYKYKDSIESVQIKGYSSSENKRAKKQEDKYKLNLELSQKRADIFLDYIKNIPHSFIKENQEWMDNTFKAVGKSSSELIYNQKGIEDKKASRRVEVEIIFKENFLSELLKEEEPKTNYMDLGYSIENKKVIYLADFIKRLLIESPTLSEKFNFLQSLTKDIEIAKAAFRPTVDLNYKYTNYSKSQPDRFTHKHSRDITLRYNLFNKFKDQREKEISIYNHKSNIYVKDQVEADLIFKLTEAFIIIQKQKDIVDLARKNLQDYDQWIEKEDIKFQNGLVSLHDYAKVQARDTTQRMNFKELEREYNDAISTFKRYLYFNVKDIPYFEKLRPYSKYLKSKDLALNDSLTLSPFIKEANSNVVLYKQKMDQQKVTFYPVVDLIGKLSMLDEEYENRPKDETNENSIALEAKLNLYSGGKEQANYDKKLFEYRQKIQKRDEVIRDTKYKIDLSFNNYKLVLQKDELLTNLIKKREESYLGATYDYKFAKIDADELLDAVDSLYNAKRLYIVNKYDIQVEQYKILNNVGVIKNYILEEWVKE